MRAEEIKAAIKKLESAWMKEYLKAKSCETKLKDIREQLSKKRKLLTFHETQSKRINAGV